MASENQQNVEKVPCQTGVSLTPTAKEQRDMFPPLPHVPAGTPTAFQRSSRLARSPPPGPQHRASVGEAMDQETPKASAPPLREVYPKEKNASLAASKVGEEIKKMREVIIDMKAAMERQRNVSMGVRNGVAFLEQSIDIIDSMRQFWRVSMERFQKECTERETQTSPLMAAAVLAAASKRSAQSPPDSQREGKRQRDTGEVVSTATPEGDGFRQVLSKKERKKAKAKERQEKRREEAAKAPATQAPKPKSIQRRPKTRPDAVLIKPADGKSYADVLGAIRTSIKPGDNGAEVRCVRKTRSGEVLVELGPGTKDKSKFGEVLRTTLGANATVRCTVPKSTVELRDLDELTTEEEVTTVLNAMLGKTFDGKVFVSKANTRGQKIAIVTLPVPDAETILKKGRIKIGWVSCRIRLKLSVPRCFKCLGYGHVAGACKGTDRSNLCFKCGGNTHKAAACKETPSCVLCAKPGISPEELSHIPGSSRCAAYKAALESLKSRRR